MELMFHSYFSSVLTSVPFTPSFTSFSSMPRFALSPFHGEQFETVLSVTTLFLKVFAGAFMTPSFLLTGYRTLFVCLCPPFLFHHWKEGMAAFVCERLSRSFLLLSGTFSLSNFVPPILKPSILSALPPPLFGMEFIPSFSFSYFL